MKWYILRNPKARQATALRLWPKIERQIKASGQAYEGQDVRNRQEMLQQIQLYLKEGGQNFLVLGGDGSLNAAANALLGQSFRAVEELCLAHIPLGWGNHYAAPRSKYRPWKGLAQGMRNPQMSYQDVGLLSWKRGEKTYQRYFLHLVQMGWLAQYYQGLQKRAPKNIRLLTKWQFFQSWKQQSQIGPTEIALNGQKQALAPFFNFAVGLQKDQESFSWRSQEKKAHLGQLLFPQALLNGPKTSPQSIQDIQLQLPAHWPISIDGDPIIRSGNQLHFQLLPKQLRLLQF